MSIPVKTSYLEIGSVGSFAIRVPITTLGEGKPHLAVICGIHGDETAGLVISRYFVQNLIQRNSLQGTVSIVTAANPLAQAIRSRVVHSDFYDLNRTGHGRPEGYLTERLAHKLCEFLSVCSFIIDLHEFGMDTSTMAIYISSENFEVDQLTLKAIAAFNPSTVWGLELTSPEEAMYSDAILSVLIRSGIPGFAIETSRVVALSSDDIQNIVDGLLEVSKVIDIIEGQYRTSLPIAFNRTVKHSDQAGIWIPTAKMMSHIQAGEKIGEFTSLSLLEYSDIVASVDGIIIQIRSPNLVETGTSLFAIGVKNDEVLAKFQTLVTEETVEKE